MKNPCWNCPDRNGTCHGECDKYGAYWKAQRALDHQRLVEVAINDVMHNGIIRQRKRAHLMGT